jgi:hypothetical protein
MESAAPPEAESALTSDSHASECGETVGYRTRKPTEKGLSYSKQQLYERCNKSWRSTNQRINYISHMLDVGANVVVVEGEWQRCESSLVEYFELNLALRQLLSEEEIIQDELEIQKNEVIALNF